MLVSLSNYRSHVKGHPYHLVDVSPWPLMASLSVLVLTIGGVMFFNGYVLGGLTVSSGLILVTAVSILWWRDVIREGTYQGHHTHVVERGLKIGFILFVLTEVIFFVSWFWAFFHSALAPTVEIGCIWPPVGFETLNPWVVPLLNTVILLSSGASSTWVHNALLVGGSKGYREAVNGLILTVVLGVIFTSLQGFEYYTAPFTIADGIYGSTFYMATGFHGIHVIIGTIFLAVGLWRILISHFTNKHHLGFESALWYWHFVDVVWGFLFVSIYWWGS